MTRNSRQVESGAPPGACPHNPYDQEDTCMSYEEEDTCKSKVEHLLVRILTIQGQFVGDFRACILQKKPAVLNVGRIHPVKPCCCQGKQTVKQ
jgi:hypothetical protein